MRRASWLGQLYVQVIIGIVIGGLLGFFWPSFAVTLQPFADGFIKLIKMLLAPIIFATVVLGLAKMGNIKEVGRIGVRAILYFEVASTLALVIGLVVVNVVRPGVGMNIDAGQIDASAITGYTRAAASHGGTVDFLLDIIPEQHGRRLHQRRDAAGDPDRLARAASRWCSSGIRRSRWSTVIDTSLLMLFRIVGMVMRLAPARRRRGRRLHHRASRHRHALVARLPDALGLRRPRSCSSSWCWALWRGGPASRCCTSSATSRTSCW